MIKALDGREHGGCVRGVGDFVSQPQYFNIVKWKTKMTPKVEVCQSDKVSKSKTYNKKSNQWRSSIGSVIIDLNNDEDMRNTPRKGLEVIEFVVNFKILTICCS